MKRFYVLIVIFTCISLLLGGCYSAADAEPADTNDLSTSESTTSVDDENVNEPISFKTYKAPHFFTRAIQQESPYPTGDGGYYYIPFLSADTLYYMDSSGYRTPLCGIGGCKHNDDSCPAHFDGLSHFIAFDGAYYAQTEHAHDVGESVDIYSVDFTTGERSLLYRKVADESSMITAYNFVCTKDVLLFCTRSTNISDNTSIETLERVNLTDETQKTLRTFQDNGSSRNMGAVSAGLVVETTTISGHAMQYPEYILLHPDATMEEYDEYYFTTEAKNRHRKLEILDADGNVLETLADSDEGYKSPTDGDITWNDYIAYQIGEDFYLYDVANGTKTVLKEFDGFFEGISSYQFLDGRIIAIHALDEDAEYNYEVYCYDINTNELYKTNNNDGLPAIYGETDEGFVASASEGLIYITKENYYLGAFGKGTVLLEYTN